MGHQSPKDRQRREAEEPGEGGDRRTLEIVGPGNAGRTVGDKGRTDHEESNPADQARHMSGGTPRLSWHYGTVRMIVQIQTV